MPHYRLISKPAAKKPRVRLIKRPIVLGGCVALGAALWFGAGGPDSAAFWSVPVAQASSPCPPAWIDHTADGRIELRFVKWRPPAGHHVYGFAAPDGKDRHREPLAAQPDASYPHYDVPLPSGWLYVIVTPERVSGLAPYAFASPILGLVDDSKGMGGPTEMDGPEQVHLQPARVKPAGISAAAQVCSVQF